MKIFFIKKLINLSKSSKDLEKMLSSKKVINDHKIFCKLSQKYSKLKKIKNLFFQWKNIHKKIKKTKMFFNDPDQEIKKLVQEEINLFNKKKEIVEKKIKILFLPKNKNDKRNCYIEIHAATGGDEAAIFAGDLLKMYIRYAELNKWHVEIIHSSYGEHGGYKEVIIKIIGLNAYGNLKFESGGHRVQRVPKTESQGRIHTSTCTVAVIPELLKTELTKINLSDLKIDTFRSSGAGGQHVNTTDSAIRITHVPTGIVVACQDERSQHKNKARALEVLGARIHANEIANREAQQASTKKNLLGTGIRSDRNRTYNFAQGRITDHRVNFTLYQLDEIMSGKLDLLINKIIQKISLFE